MVELSILQAVVYAILIFLLGALIGAVLAILMVASGSDHSRDILDNDEYADRIRKMK